MRDETRRVRRGETLEMRLPSGVTAEAAKAAPRRGDSEGVGGEDELYVFKKKGCKIYDAGTAPRDGGGYELVADALVKPVDDSGTSVVTQAVFDAFIASQEAKYLSGIFGNTGGRPNKRPFRYESEQLWVDVVQTDSDEIAHPSVIGQDLTRPLLSDSFANDDSALTAPPGRNTGWTKSTKSSDIDFSTDFSGRADGLFKVVSGIKAIRIYAYGFFLDFDTADTTRFKVTRGAMTDEEVVLGDLKDLTGIYLIPYVSGNSVSTLVPDEFGHPVSHCEWFQRLIPPEDIVFRYNGFSYNLVTAFNGQHFPNATGSTALSLRDTIKSSPISIVDVRGASCFMSWKNNIPFQLGYQWAGALRGVLKTKGGAYYIYLKPATNDVFGHPYEPDFINVGTIVSGTARF